MKALMLPYYTDNPYQDLLADNLRDLGVDVSTQEDPKPFYVFIHRVFLSDVDILHIHWTHPYFLFGGKKLLYRIPGSFIVATVAALWFLLQVTIAQLVVDSVIWTVHNKHNHEKEFLVLDTWVSRRVARIADCIQVWDPNTRTEVTGLFDVPPEKTVCIPHGNYIPVYEESGVPTKQEAREQLGMSDWDRVYLYFGMIRPYKNVTGLVRAFQDSGIEACLYIAGNPVHNDLETEIRELVADDERIHTEFRFVPNTEVPKMFAAADAVVFPYEDIFNSGSVLLAMSLARPFVAPRQGSIPTIAPEGNILYDDLSDALSELHQQTSNELEATGKRNYERAAVEHNWSDIATKTIDMYTNCSPSREDSG